MRHAVLSLSFFLAVGTAVAEDAPRTLAFEDRVRAQEAIERVYRSHRIGGAAPSEGVLPLEAIEGKVRKYLGQSDVLAVRWNTVLNDGMLQRELERMARGTRMPERLLELYAALGNDPFLVKECLARPILADRLARDHFAFDPSLHFDARRRAEELHRKIESGELRPTAEHPNRERVRFAREGDTAAEPEGVRDRLTAAEYRRRRAQLPRLPGQVSTLGEERDSFVFHVVLDETEDEISVARYAVPKTRWDAWWEAAKPAGDGGAETTLAADRGPLPRPSIGSSFASESGTQGGHRSPCAADDTWDNGVLGDLPDPRTDHTAVWTGSFMVVWGGSPGFSPVDTGGRYDPTTDSWMPTSTTGAPAVRMAHTAVWTGSRMLVWGGSYYENIDGTNYLRVRSDGAQYDPETDSWSQLSIVGAPSARYGHTAIWTGERMVVWGGIGSSRFNTGGQYDPASDTWTPLSTVGAPAARSSHTAVWNGTLMVVWGGVGGGWLQTGGRYDAATDQWTPTSTESAPSPRYRHSAVWTGSEMVVWGGSDANTVVNSGGRYDPSTDHWTPTPSVGAPAAREGHGAVWTGRRMIVWGGTDPSSPGLYLQSGARFDPAANAWTPTANTGAPSARTGHSTVWTGSRMVIWGGIGGSIHNSGGRYDPEVDRWMPTSEMGAPSARASHTAVWTGNHLVIWGGYNGPSLDTGSRYDPALDTWTPVSTNGAPSPRRNHTAVWSGGRMIVWGGRDGSIALGTGGRYDPATDQWAPTSTVDAPAARYLHAAVWTGNLMLVWGGRDAGSYFNSGARYDPATDQWTPMSALEAPAARALHTSVWTGGLMVAWGGHDGTNDLGTGGRYDPASDVWTPTSANGAPSPRRGHTTVWSGSRMIVWGGRAGSVRFSTGGRYDPATDLWTPTSTVDAPSARFGHTSVWTGRELVAWGGYDGTDYTGTGGRYDPGTDLWTATSATLAPSGRESHTATWTGSLMVVWGGGNASFLNTGGRYVLGASVDDDHDGYSECGGDCNDGNPEVRPGASESCNGIDDDCSGIADDGGDTLCEDGNPCTDDVCEAAAGRCAHAAEPDGNPCDDGDLCTVGDACLAGSCTPAFSGLDEPNPRTSGYYKRLCRGPHSGDALSDDDAACVSRITATFAGITTVTEICEVIEPSSPNGDACGRSEDDLMALALNLCRARVCHVQRIESQCGDNVDVGHSMAESDNLLHSPERTPDACAHAKCLDEEINTGRALEMSSLRLTREVLGTRLSWNPPHLDEGTGQPRKYHVWRRALGSSSPFTQLGETTATTFLDETPGDEATEYEVTAVMR